MAGAIEPGAIQPGAIEPGAIQLTLVVPAYDEIARLEDGFTRLTDAMHRGAVDPATTEVVLVDDGSTDGTDRLASQLLAGLPHGRLVRHDRNRGKGAAIRTGVAEARGAVIAFGDADMAIEPDQFPLLVGALADADVAIGARRLPGSRTTGGTARRRAMGRVFNRLVNAATGLGLGDTQCGFKGFRAPVARLLFHCSVIDGFAFDVEVLYTARQLGLRIDEVPVRWRNVDGTRIRPLADPAAMAVDILGGWARRRAPAPVPALAVPMSEPGSPPAARLAAQAAGSSLPVLAEPDGSALVLLPLTTRHELERVARRLFDLRGSGAPPVLHRSVSLGELHRRAPLRLVASDAEPGQSEPSQAGTRSSRRTSHSSEVTA